MTKDGEPEPPRYPSNQINIAGNNTYKIFKTEPFMDNTAPNRVSQRSYDQASPNQYLRSRADPTHDSIIEPRRPRVQQTTQRLLAPDQKQRCQTIAQHPSCPNYKPHALLLTPSTFNNPTTLAFSSSFKNMVIILNLSTLGRAVTNVLAVGVLLSDELAGSSEVESKISWIVETMLRSREAVSDVPNKGLTRDGGIDCVVLGQFVSLIVESQCLEAR